MEGKSGVRRLTAIMSRRQVEIMDVKARQQGFGAWFVWFFFSSLRNLQVAESFPWLPRVVLLLLLLLGE